MTLPSISDPAGPPTYEGDTIQTTDGTWSTCGSYQLTYTYDFERNGTIISSGSTPYYTVVAADVLQTLQSYVTACDSVTCLPETSSNSIVPADQPETPTSLSPADGTVTVATPTLSSVFSDPVSSQTGYVAYVVETPSGTVVAQGSGPTVSSGQASAWTPPTLNPGDLYYWYAQAFNSSSASSPPSAWVTFDIPPTIPTLTSPSNAAALTSATPVLSASASGVSSLQYEFQVATDSNFTNIVADSGWLQTTGTWAVSNRALQDGGSYYWRARAADAYIGVSDWSSSRSFTLSLPKLGLNNAWPIWSHGPLSVNEANGNLIVSLPAPSYRTTTGSLSFSLTYNSQATTGSAGLGPGWTLVAGDGSMSPPLKLIDHATVAPIMAAAEIIRPDGSSSFYDQVGSSSTYLAGGADGSRLTKNADGTWTLLDSDGATYTFGTETSGVALPTSAEGAASGAGNGVLSYNFNTSGQITSLAYKDTANSSPSETLTFAWGSNCTGGLLCVSGPDGRTWKYTANAGNQITGVINGGGRQLFALTYNTASTPLLVEVQNANDLDPTHASPHYNSSHNLAINYDSNSPARVSGVSDGPVTNQTPQTSTWSFSYHPGRIEPAPPRASHYGYLVRNDGPLAYYPLDDTSGTASDASGNGNNATYSGTYTQGQAGVLAGTGGGSSVSFNGGTVSGSVANLDQSPGGYTTVEMWVNWDGTNQVMPFGFGNSSAGYYALWFNGGNFGFTTGCSDLYGATAPSANSWHYVVAEFYNGFPQNGSQLWIDGVKQNLSITLGNPCKRNVASAFNISGWPSNTSYRLHGSADEVAVYGYALPATEIAAHFAEALHDPAPTAYYRLDETSGTSAADSSSNGNNATYSGTYTLGQNGAYAGSGKSVNFNGGTVSGSVANLNTAAGGVNTVEMWVKFTGGMNEGMPIGFGNSTAGYYALAFQTISRHAYLGFTTGCSDLYGVAAPGGTWHYVVAEFYNGLPQNGAKLWVDGVPQTLSIQTGTPCSRTIASNFNISGWPQNSSFRMGGSLDEVAIYNSALTPAEIASHYYTNSRATLRVGAANGYTTLTPPNQQGQSCPSKCITSFYDGSGRTIETTDTLGRTTESGYNPSGQQAWQEDADGNPTDYLYGGPNDQPTGNPSLPGVLLQTIGPDPDGAGPLTRPVTTNRYDEETIGSPSQAGTPLNGLAGTYWTGKNLSGLPAARENDPAPGSSTTSFSLPASGGGWPVSGDSSARWSGDVLIPSAGDYTFSSFSDGGTRLSLDGEDAIENWTIPGSPTTASSAPIHLNAGLHQLVLDYEHSGAGTPSITLDWSCSDCGQPTNGVTAIPTTNLLPAWNNKTSTISPAGRLSFTHYANPALGLAQYTAVLLPQAGATLFPTVTAQGGQGGGGANNCTAGAGGSGGTAGTGSSISVSYQGGGGGSGDVYCNLGAVTGGGGGSSAGTATNGNNGLTGVFRTGGDVNLGGPAPTGGGAGGGSQWQPGDGGYPGSAPGGGGGASGAATLSTSCASYYTAGVGAPGKAVITPNSGSPITYSSAGAYSYTVPTGVTSLVVELWGGGGGGGRGYGSVNGGASGGGGGGGGAYTKTTSIAVTTGETLNITVGAGGAAGVNGGGVGCTGSPNGLASTGTAGGTSSVQDATPPLITSYSYDTYGRLTQQVMPKGNTGRTIAPNGDLQGTGDATYATNNVYYGPGETAQPPNAPNCTGSLVNQYEQLKSSSQHGDATITYVYDASGNTIATTNGAGITCSQYDSENRLSNTEAPNDSARTNFTYDPAGALLTASGPTGTVTTYYDEQGRLVDETDATGAEASYSYDADGNLLTRLAATGPLSSSTNYETCYRYDAGDRLAAEAVVDPGATCDPLNTPTYSFYYDTRGNLRGTQYPNGTFSWIDTNPDGWISDQYNRHGTISSATTSPPSDSSPLADYTYTYDEDGKRLSEIRTSGSTSQTTYYSYDGLGRLSQVLLPTGTCRDYSYDADSNRSQIQESATGCAGTFSTTASYTYDPNTTPGVDQLTGISAGDTTSYAYTTDGQVETYGTTSLAWDGWGRLATATVNSNTVTYTYDPAGALMTRTSSSPATTTNYLLGDLFETNGGGTITTSYTDGPAGDLTSFNGPPTSSSTATYLYYDAHGNVAAEANSSGTQTGNHTYDPFGAPIDSAPSNQTVHRFTGRWNKQYDTASKLILMGARPYDPATGRFLAVDPIPGGSLNNYDYANQDPVNNYDLNGLSPGDIEELIILGLDDFARTSFTYAGEAADWGPLTEYAQEAAAREITVEETLANPARLEKLSIKGANKLFGDLSDEGWTVDAGRRGGDIRAFDGKGNMILLERNFNHPELSEFYWRVSLNGAKMWFNALFK